MKKFLFVSVMSLGWLSLAIVTQAQTLPALSDGDSKNPVEVTADGSLEWRASEGRFLAIGNAMVSRGNLRVRADELSAYQEKMPDGTTTLTRLEANGNVQITSGSTTISGEAGTYDMQQQRAILTGRNLRFANGTTTLTARDRLEYNGATREAQAVGQVLAVQQGRRISADTMVARLRPNAQGQDDVQQVIATGNVVVATAQDVARGQRLVYDVPRAAAVLTGKVQITRGESQFAGDVADIDFTRGLSRLLPAEGGGRVRALLGGAP